MPRPKGSHNKPKNPLVSELEQSVENIDERIAEAEKAIEIRLSSQSCA